MSSAFCSDEASAEPALTLADRLARRLVLRSLDKLRDGAVELHDAEGVMRFGREAADLPKVAIYVRSPAFYRRLIGAGALGGGEAWIAGDWHCNDLTSALRLVLRNAPAARALDGGLAKLALPARALLRRRSRNTHAGSRRNIRAHYDLSNEFFALFLDPSMTYSSGFFEHPGATMEEASIAKIDRLCRQLALKPQHHLLEIGTGWGALAIHAARHYGCRVTTTTISREQHAFASERIAAAGLRERIDVRLDDYRDLRGRYDRLVSVEMIEAVGAEYFETFFRVCSERLKDDGAMALQAITIDDRHFDRASKKVDFIKKYVFPGGCLPSLGSIASDLAQATDLRIAHLTSMTSHYAETLRRWRSALDAEREACRGLGLDDEFLRLWEYYLSYCEAGFEERHIGCIQLVAAKPGYREAIGVAKAAAPARIWGA